MEQGTEQKTREKWLEQAIEEFFRPHFERTAVEALKKSSAAFPERVRVSIGFPDKGGTSKKGKTLGQCWKREASNDGAPHIFINPIVEDVIGEQGILSILAHELVHACGVRGHKKDFGRVAGAIGLIAPWKSTRADAELMSHFERLVSVIGEYPHGGIVLNGLESPVKPDRCRMVKCVCTPCGYTVRTTMKWIEVAVPKCPVCNEEMSINN